MRPLSSPGALAEGVRDDHAALALLKEESLEGIRGYIAFPED